MYTDEEGNTVETPINKLPNNFWHNVGSDEDEENNDGESRYGGKSISGQSMMSEATTVKIFDGHGGSYIKNLDGQMGLGEVRHSNTMTEDRRDYGALYYNLGLGADRVQ